MKHLIPFGIIVLAAFFRLYSLSHVPPAPSLDEVSIGYNAYSILHTGKDEYGTPFPMLLRAYDDYRPALYVYLTIPFVSIFGLTAVAVRLPSVLLSLVTVYVVFLLGKMIGKKYCSFERLGEFAAVLLAISPWHIYLSRLGHEVNVGLALVTAAVYFFLRAALEGKNYYWILSAIMFGLSVHGYQSEKVISPLLVLSGMLLFWKELWKAKRHIWVAGIVGMLIAWPAVAATFSPQGLIRFRGTTAFSSDAPIVVESTKQYIAAQARGDRIGQMIHSRLVANAAIFSQNYVSHFSSAWLFTGGAREAHKVPDMGLLYLWEAPMLLLGFWVLMRSKMPRKLVFFLIWWLLISPLPAAITTQAPHAMRSYTAVVVIAIIVALGFWRIVTGVRKKQLHLVAIVVGLGFASGMSSFWRGYFVRLPIEQSDSFQYGMKQAIYYAKDESSRYAAIQFSNQGNLYQSYMFFLYYTRFDPAIYLELGGTVSGGYEEAHVIGTYAFGILPQDPRLMSADTLYFYDAAQVPQGIRIIKTFTNLDGKPAIIAGAL